MNCVDERGLVHMISQAASMSARGGSPPSTLGEGSTTDVERVRDLMAVAPGQLYPRLKGKRSVFGKVVS